MSKIALKLVEEMHLSWDCGQGFHTDSIFGSSDFCIRRLKKCAPALRNIWMEKNAKSNIKHIFLRLYYQNKFRRVRGMYGPNNIRLENYFQRILQLAPGRRAFLWALKEKLACDGCLRAYTSSLKFSLQKIRLKQDHIMKYVLDEILALL